MKDSSARGLGMKMALVVFLASLASLAACSPNPPPSPSFPPPTTTVPSDCNLRDNCYPPDQMRQLLEDAIPLVNEFFDSAYAQMPHPENFYFIGSGETTDTACGQQDDMVFAYCPGDHSIYLGQAQLWTFYQQFGSAGIVVGLAHEWGHHVQSEVGVPEPNPAVPNESIPHENQADCIAGAWVDYADRGGMIQYPADIVNVAGLLATLGEAESPNQTHGTPSARERSFDLGFTQGLHECNAFYPTVPIIG